MATDPNMMAALESFAGDPATAVAPPVGPAPEPVACGACGAIIDPVTGAPVDGGGAPPPLV